MFFFPLRDEGTSEDLPVVTGLLMAACILVACVEFWTVPRDQFEAFVRMFGLVPFNLFNFVEAPIAAVAAVSNLATSMFLHGGWSHLIGNMAILWVVGNRVEDVMGHGRFLLFYLLCGLVAAFAHAAANPASTVPMVGASGAIAGMMGAFLLLHPLRNVRVLLGLVWWFRTFPLPALVLFGPWFYLQLYMAWTDQGGNVAVWAHIAGFMAGLVLLPLFKRQEVPLLEGVL